MNQNTIIQIPVKKTFRDQLALAVEELGFSSIQDATRLYFKQIVARTVYVNIQTIPTTILAKDASRNEKMADDLMLGKTKPTKHARL